MLFQIQMHCMSQWHLVIRLVEPIKSILERDPPQFNLENSILMRTTNNFNDDCSVSSRGLIPLEVAPFVFVPLE
jgi:hypothetical protein